MDKKEVKLSADERQFFVATRMSLPLFMLSRNRLREDHLEGVQKQFKLAAGHYNMYCQQENRREKFSTATYNHFRHVTGFEKTPPSPPKERRPLSCNRSVTAWRDYHQAPNRYGVLPVPYQSRMGSKGTLFPKIHTNKSKVPIKQPAPHIYELPSEVQRFFKPENKQKGIFLSNARERRGTSRLMISNLANCWRDPADPGPADTYTASHSIEANMTPVTKEPPDNPHLFLRRSCVPTTSSIYVRKNASFEPAPGRYEVSYSNQCPCERGKIRMPKLALLIEQQKRLKFRGLPYKRINPRKYCDPEWRSVKGHGHKHIFQMGKHDLPKPEPKKLGAKGKKAEKQLKLFADGKYLNMLVNPRRNSISLRDFSLIPYEPKIVYNCIAKRATRKQLRNNKKVAFLSGQERWKDGVRMLQMTQRQLNEIKARVRPERRLTDHPIELRPEKVVSRLHQLPEHMRSSYMPHLRKRLFKFLPIPEARVLVTDNEIRPDLPFNRDHPTGLYNEDIDPTKFFYEQVLDGPKPERVGDDISGLSMTNSASSTARPSINQSFRNSALSN